MEQYILEYNYRLMSINNLFTTGGFFMNINEVLQNARNNMKGFCNVCKECNGVWCAGKVPGMGGCGTGDSFKRNYSTLKNVRLKLKTIHNVKTPSTKVNIFGKELDLPLLAAPITGASYNMGGFLSEEEYVNAAIIGSFNSNTLGMIGDGADLKLYQYGIDAIKKINGNGIAIIKPRENKDIIERIKIAEEAGCIAVGIDIDGAGLVTMALNNQPVGPKSVDELKELVSSTSLPFIIKGIMDEEEAELAYKAGAAAIVVSNHGGRVLDDTLGVAEVLPKIAKKLKGKITILADGNVRQGSDIFKYIALGADAVLVGRPIIWGAYGNNEDGVKTTINKFKNELNQTMILTGSQDVSSIDDSKIVNFNNKF
jgi:4-hydroxymandelate oxidase